MSKGKAGNAKSALRALGTHADDILEAFLRKSGQIEDTADNESLIGSLKKYRILWRLDDSENYQLRNVVSRLLDHVTENQRRHSAHEHIAGQWQYLQDKFDAYHIAVKKGLFEDRSRLEEEIPERILELIEDIRLAATSFNHYVTSELAYINNLELKIKENDRVLSRAHALNVLFDSFSLDEMAHLSIGSPFLEKLLLKHLPAALEKSRKDLGHSLYQLRKLLSRLRSEQRMVKLLASFESVYANDPGFRPDIDDIDLAICPSAINRTSSLKVHAYADINDPDQEILLADLANGIRKVPEDEELVQEAQRQAIDIPDGPDEEKMEIDPAQKAIEEIMTVVLEDGVTVSAKKSRSVLEVDIDLPSWLQMIATDVSSLPPEQRSRVRLEYKGIEDPVYWDNMFVTDIILRPTYAS
ncbi:hypothetical protein [Marinobacter alkaliphilus]|jgi:hypothetical protein|uniref:Uncharacterized protein n=1 Tax=Marinobacter alkaliphilus TaxID=254719 RepID=A0ABZ3DXY8_9GAMM|tara:strand:- start:1292 stop:2530 length:1239 start_codon:yes stop_codon:yes gene_type:complete